MENKDIRNITWCVTEDEYRADKSISYSTLATFQREGYRGLKRILDGEKIDTSSLRYGSLVDCLLTNKEKFDDIYEVVIYNKPSDLVKSIMDTIWKKRDSLKPLNKIDRGIILEHGREMGYGASNWRDDTIIDKIIEAGASYYDLLILTVDGKELVHYDDVELANKCVSTIKHHQYTNWIFEENSYSKLYYQLKFKTKYKDNHIRCMFDILKVDYANNLIIPIDLKTTSKFEDDFIYSIQDWDYDIQATMYSYILRKVIRESEEFKDFKVAPFLFLPINKFSLKPQLFRYMKSSYDTQKTFIDYKGKKHKAWYDIYDDVMWHIDNDVFDYPIQAVMGSGVTNIEFN